MRANGGDSLRAAARAVASPRVWAIVGMVSGWAFAAAAYVAGSARQADVVTVQADVRAAAAAAAVAEVHATEAGKAALATHDASALAFRAVVGLLAYERARGGSAAARLQAQAAAEVRYDRALTEGQAPASAVRSALQ